MRLAQLMIDTKNTFQELQTNKQNLNNTVRHATIYKKSDGKNAFNFDVEPEQRDEEVKEVAPEHAENDPEPQVHDEVVVEDEPARPVVQQ